MTFDLSRRSDVLIAIISPILLLAAWQLAVVSGFVDYRFVPAPLQIVDTFGTQNKNLFNQVVLVEFPRPGIWAIGFLTNKTQGEAQAKTAEEVWTVFVPTTPNPTSGFLILFPAREITPLEMSVGEGMKMIISGGAVVPPWPAVKAADLAK